jgi:hypothetical protein
MPQVQITEIEFDLDTLDSIQQPNMKESLQEEYVGQIYDLDMCCYDEVNDETVCDCLVQEIANQSGLYINLINFDYVLS